MMWFVKPEVKMTKWGCGDYSCPNSRNMIWWWLQSCWAQCLRTPGDFELWWPKPTGVWDAVWQCVHTVQFGLRKVIVCAWCFPDRQLALIMDLLWITLSLRKISCKIWCWHSPAFWHSCWISGVSGWKETGTLMVIYNCQNWNLAKLVWDAEYEVLLILLLRAQ
jgi:hypothetical protein